MKVQEAAHKLLLTEGHPMSSRQIATMALDRGLVQSASDDPVFSIASTIEKNIRTGTYNRPALVFLRGPSGRQVGLPNWKPADIRYEPTRRTVSVSIPEELAEKLRLAAQAKIAPSFEETVAWILRRGLKEAAPKIRGALLKQVDGLE